MNENHVLSDEILDKVTIALTKGDNWIAYNRSLYFIDKNDIFFFDNRDSANEFANNNFSDGDSFNVIHITSIQDLFKQVPYYESIIQTAYLKKQNDKQLSLFNTTKTNVMNEQNLKYLKDNIKYMGFGENLNEALENNLKEGKPEFQLVYKAEINRKPFEATLQFRKSDASDMYFFNSYRANLQKSNGEKVDQTFYVNKGKGFTAKEAFNLMDGRSVNKELTNKEGHSYNAWVQLDFEKKDRHNNFEMKQYHQNYGYDLKEAVSRYAVTELKDPEKEKLLMQSLQRGNRQAVIVEKDGNAYKMFLEANPQFKSVNLYDGQMERLQKESLEQYRSNGQSQCKEVTLEEKAEVKKNDNLKPDVANEINRDAKEIKPDATKQNNLDASKENKQDVGKEQKQEVKRENQQKNSLLPKKMNGNGLMQKKRISSRKGLAV